MPSDPRTQLALDALAAPRARFRHALEVAREQMTAWVATHHPGRPAHSRFAVNELGAFAAGRIDSDRFARLFSSGDAPAPESVAAIDRCIEVLEELVARTDELFCHELPPGGDFAASIGATYATLGRAFGAVVGFQAAKAGAFRADRHHPLLERFPFAIWNRAERLLAPPLVVEVDGADLRADELRRYLDGNVRIVLVVRGPAPPVPLLPLITPGTLVMQGDDTMPLAAVAEATGPAIAAFMPAGSARFAHLPTPGAPLAERLTVAHLPPDQPWPALAGRSAWQQREDVAQLAALARAGERAVTIVDPGSTVAAASAGMPAAKAVDTLTAWLLDAGGYGVTAARSDGSAS